MSEWQSWHGVISDPNAKRFQSITSTPVTFTGDVPPASFQPARFDNFILVKVLVDGISYHVARVDRASWWPQSKDSGRREDAKVFSASNPEDCIEAIDLMLAHGYQIIKA